jgi:hypothetical protein
MILRMKRRYLITALPSNTPVCYFIISTRKAQIMWQTLAKASDVLITPAPRRFRDANR